MHASIACSLKPAIDWIAASDLEDESEQSVWMLFVRYDYISCPSYLSIKIQTLVV